MSASRSRQKRKLEPISIEELAGTTGMSGFCSFLTRDSSIPVPILDGVESGAPEQPPPEQPAPEEPAPQRTAPQPPAPAEPAPDRPAVKLGALEGAALDSRYGTQSSILAPETSAPETAATERTAPVMTAAEGSAEIRAALDPADFRYRRRPRIRAVVTLQDGHSLAEQAVYDAIWREGKPYRGDSRIITIGLRTLAEISRMAYSNCKANVRSLVAKLALDELPGFSYTDGRTYIIYGDAEILRRRKEAGLTHVLRTRGVAFVDPVSGAPLTVASVTSAPLSSALDKG